MSSDLLWVIKRFSVVKSLIKITNQKKYFGMRLGSLWSFMEFAITGTILSLMFTLVLGVDPVDFIPHLIIGLAVWNLINNTITQSGIAVAGFKSIALDFPFPPMLYFVVHLLTKIIELSFNLVSAYLISVIVSGSYHVQILHLVIGIIIISAVAGLVSITTGFALLAVKDLRYVISTIFRALFFATPIIWMPHTRPALATISKYNPLYHLLELVRSPLRGGIPEVSSYLIALATLLVAAVLAKAAYKYSRYRFNIWLD